MGVVFEFVAQFVVELLAHIGLEVGTEAIRKFWGDNGVFIAGLLLMCGIIVGLGLFV